MDELLELIDAWVAQAEASGRWYFNPATHGSEIRIPFDQWERLGRILGVEDEDPRSMGWVSDSGLP